MGMKDVAKVIEIVGSSEKNWVDAADTAVAKASKTISNITGIQIMQMTASCENGKVVRYKTTLKVAFGLD